MFGDFEIFFSLKITEVENSFSLLAFFSTASMECVANKLLQINHQKQSIENIQRQKICCKQHVAGNVADNLLQTIY